jgi:hypothetical protein
MADSVAVSVFLTKSPGTTASITPNIPKGVITGIGYGIQSEN